MQGVNKNIKFKYTAEMLINEVLGGNYMKENTGEIYLDDEEEGLSKETSHPNFVNHFTEDFYYDCGDEEAPFGNDNGADTLYELEDLIKSGDYKGKFLTFPKKIVSDIWDLNYLEPENFDKEKIKKLIEDDEYSLVATDQVIIAVALGEIKILGKIEPELKKTALNAMKRQKIVFEMLGYDGSGEYDQIMKDLESFENK